MEETDLEQKTEVEYEVIDLVAALDLLYEANYPDKRNKLADVTKVGYTGISILAALEIIGFDKRQAYSEATILIENGVIRFNEETEMYHLSHQVLQEYHAYMADKERN